MTRRVLVVHGPGLDLRRRGVRTAPPRDLRELDQRCRASGTAAGLDVVIHHADSEHALVRILREPEAAGAVVTAGDLAFSSRALAKAVAEAGVPVVDLHAGDLRRQGRSPAGSLLHRAGARTLHGRGADGHRDALAHLGHLLAHPPRTSAYGPSRDQVGDLRLPEGRGPHAVVVLLHGGFWLDPWERDLMDGLAVDLVRRGAATWNAEYRRMGGEGGWPMTAHDAAAAIAHLAVLAREHPLDLDRVASVGHSAGGQLALVSAAEGGSVTPVRVVVLAGLVDLAAAAEEGLGGGAASAFLAQAGAEPRRASPIERLPIGVPQVIAHTAEDEVVPVAHSRSYADAARRAGDEIICREVTAGDHFALIDPASNAWRTVAGDVLEPIQPT